MLKFNRLVVVHSVAASRAPEYERRVNHELKRIAAAHGVQLVEILLENTPHFEAVAKVRDSLVDGDVVFGAGGDGISQVTMEGAFASGHDVTVGFLPLGNANDFAAALNGRVKRPQKILSSRVVDFHPLEIKINGQQMFYVAAYATLGVTTVAVDALNSETMRHKRKRFAKLSPVAALRPQQLGSLSRAVNAINFPPFRRDGQIYNDDSVGFFLCPAAKGLLRPTGDVNNFLTREDFFFHHDNVRAKSPGQGWFGKSLRAGRWAALGLPGVVSDYEQLEFLHPADMLINIGGDTVDLRQVHTIGAERARGAVKVFTPLRR